MPNVGKHHEVVHLRLRVVYPRDQFNLEFEVAHVYLADDH
jgi:hypothetical protein